jgi:uncharacterized membrane protein (UPF0182 family)
MLRRRLTVVLVVTALVLALGFPAASALVADWWWFQEIGYQVVFTRELLTRAAVFFAAGAVIAGTLYVNLRAAQRGVVPQPVVYRFGESAAAVNLTAILRRLSLPVSLVVGALGGLAAIPAWDLILLAIHRTPFGITDPVFSRDIGFYVFTLPVLAALHGFLIAVVTLSLLLVAPVYVFRGDIILGPRRVGIEPSAAVHLALLIAALFLITAFRLWLIDVPALLFSTTGPLVGASFTDLHATLPALRVSAVVAVAAAAVVVVGALRGRLAPYAAWAVGAYVLVALVGRGAIPFAIQKFVVAPTELTRETPYLRHHILATRQAWGLDRVESRDLETQAELTLADIRANAATIENVRLWDRAPLLETFGQLQEIRTYYDFISVDDDRYWIDGRYRQVLLSPRELNAGSLPTRTFINEHLTFTHGMGLTLAPVNQVTAEGLPVLFVKDLPPATTGSLRITRPQIYYGEMANEFVFVKTRQREFDHPAGEANVYAEYTGTGGVPVGNLLRRALLAARFGSSKILFSGDITSESRALYHRDIKARARKALPFLRFDGDPYMVIADDGTLQWILDGYTVSNGYPYAQRLEGGVNYMRNSVKVVLDAYHGSVSAYQSEPGDPLIRAWARIFPGLLQPLDSMPADLKGHIRVPHEYYRIQTALYTTYHMDEPEDFYHREDQWQIPVQGERDGTVPLMRHIIMKLPDEPGAEFIYMVPFTPRGKDNLAAWMVARNDGPAYGGLRVYRFPRQSLVFGPRQILNRINQDTEISRQVSLWDRAGSRVIRGDLLVIPIQQSLIYVQPVYLQAEGGRIPELKRVVVAHENRVVMEETLDAALARLFGGASAPAPPRVESVVAEGALAPDAALRELAAEAFRRYQAALQAQREGDWARYGEEVRRLGSVLERLQASPPPGPR